MDDLYQFSSSSASTVVKSSTTSSSWFSLPDFTNFNVNEFINSLNTFTLAWTIFFSVIFMANFFYFRIFYSFGEVQREKKGVDSVYASLRIWVTYLIVWTFFFLFVENVGGFNWLWIPLIFVTSFIKIFLLDASTLPGFIEILGPLAPFFGQPLLQIPGSIVAKISSLFAKK